LEKGHILLGELLKKSGLISNEQLEEALRYQRKTGKRLGSSLVELGYLTESNLMETLRAHWGISFVKITRADIDLQLIQLLPTQLIERHKILPLRREGNRLHLAMVDPLNVWAIEDVRMATGCEVSPVMVSEGDMEWTLNQISGLGIRGRLEKMMKDVVGLDDFGTAEEVSEAELREMVEEAPIIRLVNAIVTQAVASKASDVHVEPREGDVCIRYRIDGILFEVMTSPKRTQAALISRLKIMANMNIAERRVPQDGRIRIVIENRDIDFRVSTLPTVFGEKVVLRILDRQQGLLDLTELNLQAENNDRFQAMIQRPFGIIMATGPTGSGKTTTLYSSLNHISNTEKNVITLEDPVEYMLPGINQVQVNPKAGLTFANGLRAILRQDPDIVMVGEIRDEETARLAVHAALTGHLVLSTLHTNTAVGTIARLIDMGIEPFLLASALGGIIAQRLVRKLCLECRIPSVLSSDVEAQFAEHLRFIPDRNFYRAGGCNSCNNTGYKGRIAIHEVLLLDSVLKDLITARASESELEEAALRQGMRTLIRDGISKAAQGLTTFSEVIKSVYLGS